MSSPTPVEKFRRDYQPPDFQVDSLELDFDLRAEFTTVRATMHLRRAEGSDPLAPLRLDGEGLEHLGAWVDGTEVEPERISVGAEHLCIEQLPERFELRTEVRLKPEQNTQLSGLYRTSGNYCTQCEAEGFRRITWFFDRPDVMTIFRVRIEADQKACPVLLSNGNRVDGGGLEGGRHFALWHDPFPKPSYLFALVAGNLASIHSTFRTCSGREVDLYVYSEHDNAAQLDHAMECLQRSMAWDEQVFGLEYDLDIYNIVAVNDFNMGAMENKSLNVFNTVYVLARPDTATDADYENILGVIGHEYFHNWTGNRVTCRDWFQLTLKEGLTVFRDQQFSADQTSAAVKRIEDVRQLRAVQFAEDAGPMAHPIRPESYIAMDNFYTTTVYQKGAEVIRMIHTLVGAGGFRKGMDLYFQRHDGQAVTCDDFRAAMADANGIDLDQFERWYLQAGTPLLEARGEWLAAEGRFRLHLKQSCPATPGQADKEAFHIPVAFGLLGGDGQDLIGTRVLEMRETEQVFEFDPLDAEPVPSLLRGFSAPVRLQIERSDAELAFLLAHDSDAFNRWQAGQDLATRVLLQATAAVAAGQSVELAPHLVEAFHAILADGSLDPSLKAYALTLPGESTLAEEMSAIEPQHLHQARCAVRDGLASALRAEWQDGYQRHQIEGPYRPAPEDIGHRRMRNLCLAYLTADGNAAGLELASHQFAQASNMSDSISALGCLVDHPGSARDGALAAFEQRWLDEALVLNKWFAIQAMADRPDLLEQIEKLLAHPAFDLRNPNRVRSVLRSFCANQSGFHRPDGACYQLLADRILELDALNPQIASRLVQPLGRWRRYAAPYREGMHAQLERLQQAQLSKDTYEVVSKSLK